MFDHANFANNLNKHCNMDIPIILAICAQMHNLETLLRFYISMKSNIFGSWPVATCFHKSIDYKVYLPRFDHDRQLTEQFFVAYKITKTCKQLCLT